MDTLRLYIRVTVRIFVGVITPAHEFWRAYINADPSSFVWWFHVVFGVIAMIVFFIVLFESILLSVFKDRPNIKSDRY